MRRDGEPVHLTPTEFELLRELARNRGRLMTHRALLVEVWGIEYDDDFQVLRAHVANLRRKIEPPDGPPLHPHRPRCRLPLRRLETLHEICMRRAAFVHAALTGSGRMIEHVDLVSIALALVAFALFYLAIEALDRV